MQKVLIILPYYFPINHQRGHRWQQIAEYWQQNETEVHILTSKHQDFGEEDEINGVKVFRTGFAALKNLFYHLFNINNRRGEVATDEGGVKLGSKAGRFLQWINDVFWKKIYFPDDTSIWYFSAKKKAFACFEQQKYDVVISVGLPFTAHCVGMAVKKKYPNIKWLVDYGDPFSIQTEAPLNNHFLYKKWNESLENQVLALADYITVTTEETKALYVKHFQLDEKKVAVIPPLLSNTQVVYEEKKPNKKVILGYFGSFYKGIREPKVIIDLVEKLIEKENDWKDKLEVQIFGDVFDQFKEELSAHKNIKLCGLLPREKVFSAMQNVDFLLNISNITSYQLPSKAPDYMQSGKPILNIFFNEKDCFKTFFEKYPLILNWKNDESIEKVGDFLRKNLEKTVSKVEIEEMTAAYTVKSVSNRYKEVLESKDNEGFLRN